MKIRELLNETPDYPAVANQPGGWRIYKPKPAGEIDEDTAYAGGMGQGHSGESQRKYKPKVAGQVDEEERSLFGSALNICRTKKGPNVAMLTLLDNFVKEIETKYHPDQEGKFAQLWPEISKLL